MKNKYELAFLSDLRKKARYSKQYKQDFQLVIKYIFKRMDLIAEAHPSQFNNFIQILRRFLPDALLITILNRMRYDSIIGFRKEDDGQKYVYCMISYQKHPAQNMIGMFDIHVTPEERTKNFKKFNAMAEMIHEMSKRHRKNGYYRYLQCGNNDTTRTVLRLFKRICKRQYPDELAVDVEKSRIFLI